MRGRSVALVVAALSCALGTALIGCATSYYYIDSESYVRPSVGAGKYKTAAILYFGYTEATTVVSADVADVTDVSTRSSGLKEQDVILFSNALIDELSQSGITLVERNRVADLVREQGLIENEFVDLSDLEKVRRIGKLLKADLLIKGSVFTMLGGYRITPGEDVYHVILVGLAVRAIDSKTGQIVWSDVSTVAARRAPDDLEDTAVVSDYTVIRDMVGQMVRRFTRPRPAAVAVAGRDDCPDQPEDEDGFQDEDGCPDPDNDGDQVPDTVDECPLEAEDGDGFQDEDGCPDPDNDGDQIPDTRDKCPLEAEDRNGTDDSDGCPDAAEDRDGDGVPDAEDDCREDAEDIDGYEDQDGCPDLDNDGDRLADAQDECPLEMETLNGSKDEDGCPDNGAALVALNNDGIELRRELQFRDRPNQPLRENSKPALEVVAAFLVRTPSIGLRIEVSAKPRGNPGRDLERSKRRAETVKAFLVSHGVEDARIEAVGVASDRAPYVTLRLVER